MKKRTGRRTTNNSQEVTPTRRDLRQVHERVCNYLFASHTLSPRRLEANRKQVAKLKIEKLFPKKFDWHSYGYRAQ